ncbi:hypothetical protein Dimus_000674 [Dionaea muscipula]
MSLALSFLCPFYFHAPYSGNYGDAMTLDFLKDFHRRRVQVLSKSSADLIAFETSPNKVEAQAYAELLDDEDIKIPAWLTFNSKDGINVVSGDSLLECASILEKCKKVIAVGINCTPPRFIHGLVSSVKKLDHRYLLSSFLGFWLEKRLPKHFQAICLRTSTKSFLLSVTKDKTLSHTNTLLAKVQEINPNPFLAYNGARAKPPISSLLQGAREKDCGCPEILRWMSSRTSSGTSTLDVRRSNRISIIFVLMAEPSVDVLEDVLVDVPMDVLRVNPGVDVLVDVHRTIFLILEN